jgi:transcription antitermination protein NusB
MLGRRHFRIKVFQALYGWSLGGESRPEIVEKSLLASIEKSTELYYLQFSFFLEIIHFYQLKMEEAKFKFYPTDEEMNPSTRLLDNLVLKQIRENVDMEARFNQYKISWTEEQDMIHKVYRKIKAGKELREYLASATSSYQSDQEFIYKLFKKHIARSSELQFYCEERNIHWTDDYQAVSLLVLKTIRLLTADFDVATPFPTLFTKDQDEDEPSEDRKFILDLFRKTVLESEQFGQLIEAKTQNWELERIALTDILLIKMALTELIYFSSIPVKVTLNEYIEISKVFSTPKSKLFINGILDKMVEELKGSGRIKKTGRGLMT